MSTVIITDLTRFKTDEQVCTAAIDIQSGQCVRPMPYLRGDRCADLNIQPGAILDGEFSPHKSAAPPHTEDVNYTNLKFVGPASAEQFKSVLDRSLSNSISAGFGVPFLTNQKHIEPGQAGNCSLITIKVEPIALSIHEDQYKPGKIKASFTDASGHSFRYLSITDRGFHDFAKRHQDDGRLDQLVNLVKSQQEIYLRIGLSREFQVPHGKNGYWLQVNGIYTFPNFSEEVRSYG